jgi:hypothetical protein
MKSVVGLGGWLQFRIVGVALVTFFGGLVFSFPLLTVTRWTLREKVGRGD